MSFCFLYDTNGIIKEKQPNVSIWTNTNYYDSNIVGHILLDDTDATAQDAFAHSEKYLVQNNELVLQPYFTLTFANGTITATLNNPPGTPPTQATFSVLGQAYTRTLTNNQATLSLTIHPAVANQQISVTVSATGCVDESLNIGGSDSGVSMKMVTTTTPNTISPVYRKDGEAYYACLISTESLLADIGTGISLLAHFEYKKVPAALRLMNSLIAWAKSSTYTPFAPSAQDTSDITEITLTADETNVMNDITTNVLPNLYTTLANAFPSGGTKQLQYSNYAVHTQSTFNSFKDYMNDVQTLDWQ